LQYSGAISVRYLLLIVALSILLSASELRWYGDFEFARKEAIKQDKHIMVLVLPRGATQDLIKTVFANQPYIDKIKKGYICVIAMNGQKGSYPREMLYASKYPALFFLDNKELFICKSLTGKKITSHGVGNHLKQCK